MQTTKVKIVDENTEDQGSNKNVYKLLAEDRTSDSGAKTVELRIYYYVLS